MSRQPNLLIRRAAGILLAGALVPAMVAGSGRAAATFGAPVRLGSGSEPVIEVAPDGTIFSSPIYGLPSHSPLYRSINAGATFQSLTFTAPYNRLPGGGDSDIVLTAGPDGKNRVYFLDLWAGSNSIAVSENNGDSFTQGTPFTTLPLSDRQWISLGTRDPVTGKDTVYVVYHFIQPPSSLAFSRSRDGGLTWDLHNLPAGLGGALPGQIISDGDFVGFNYETGANQYFVYSEDAGFSWKKVKVTEYFADAWGTLTAVTMDPLNKNNLHIAYIEKFGYGVNVTSSYDRGKNWQPWPITLTTDGNSTVFPWIDARGGKVAVAWYGANQPGDPNKVTGNWTVKYAESFDAGATFSPPVDATGVVRTGLVCTGGLSCMSGRELGDFLQVAVDHAGKSLISFVKVSTAHVVKQL